MVVVVCCRGLSCWRRSFVCSAVCLSLLLRFAFVAFFRVRCSLFLVVETIARWCLLLLVCVLLRVVVWCCGSLSFLVGDVCWCVLVV